MDSSWAKLSGIKLYDWQREAGARWLEQKRGTLKVVTGVGKTLCALGIVQEVNKQNPQLRVAVVVPTKVLVHQWQEEFMLRFGLDKSAIGILGAGKSNTFSDAVRVLICVINSAAKKLPGMVDEELGKNLMLVVDECHRAGAETFKQIFATPRAYSLGLSATPERTEMGVVGNYDKSILGRELGPIIYEMNYAEAGERGLLPEFNVYHFALPLNSAEQDKYNRVSRQIVELRRQLLQGYGGRARNFHAWVQNQSQGDGEMGQLSQRYLGAAAARKQLLYKAGARRQAVFKLLDETFSENPKAKVIMFHEAIDEVEDIHQSLVKRGYPAVLEHSRLPAKVRKENVEAFRTGNAQIIVSARTLVEGFNVPEADVGIVVASNSSVRQRIQTLGRVLRKGEGDKESNIYILYIHGTVDENVYQKADWEDVVGRERNRYFYWDLKSPPREIDDPAPGVWSDKGEELSAPQKQVPLYPGQLYSAARYTGAGAVEFAGEFGDVADRQKRKRD